MSTASDSRRFPVMKSSCDASTNATATPPMILHRPVVTRPVASARRWPLNPRSSPVPRTSSTKPSNPNPRHANSTSARAGLPPGSSPIPNAPSVDRPASTVSTASTANRPAAVGSGRSR